MKLRAAIFNDRLILQETYNMLFPKHGRPQAGAKGCACTSQDSE